MAYTPYTAPPAETPDELRARIPGWGADLDPRDRPSVPKLQFRDDLTGSRGQFPDRQVEKRPRERSVEHAFLTPVFGTAQPLQGLSGVVRRFSYARYSEARAAHWLLLIAADRVDAAESHVRSLVTRHPDNPFTQAGLRSELSRHGVRSRIGRNRADVLHQSLDPLIVLAPWVGSAVAVRAAWKAAARGVARRTG